MDSLAVFPFLLWLAVMLNWLFGGMDMQYPKVIYLLNLSFHWLGGIVLSQTVFKTFWLKALMLVLALYASACYNHYLEGQASRSDFKEADVSLLNDLRTWSGEAFNIDDTSYFIYTWNARCGQCKKLAEDLLGHKSEIRLPVYPAWVDFEDREEELGIPEVIYQSTLNGGRLLRAGPEAHIYHNYLAAPVVFFKSPIYGMKVVAGYQNHNKEFVLDVLKNEEGGLQRVLWPDIVKESFAYVFYGVGFLMLFLRRR